ncbi:FAD synthetase family protein [Bacillus sp. B15-48]|uniref:FAD synthetase family protein n=1 Tax=Bacillus sp. B15-48 TaxID=1548601 RepID=UPI0019401D00|nr:FAD synthetase family protein [Bacillus sp. B15-48]MBM4760965.1 adenylyltransferase/cytidyltransferase family protein [Bacillus sp. B15-48]
METIHLNKENLAVWQQKAKPNVIALGCFDGLHHGHIKVIQMALQKAKEKNVPLAVMSFFPHPKTVIEGKDCFHYLMPLSEKEAKLKELGVDTFYLVEFDREFAALEPEEFVHQYLLKLAVVHAVAGYDFSYGRRGQGNMLRLKSDSGGRIDVTTVKKVESGGEKISSTSIRERLLTGKVEDLPKLLGQSYEVKCDWDGSCLTPHPYFTLPAPGRYAVTLKSDGQSVKTELMVVEKQLTFMKEIPVLMKGKLSVVWNHRIFGEKGRRETPNILAY